MKLVALFWLLAALLVIVVTKGRSPRAVVWGFANVIASIVAVALMIIWVMT